MDLQLTRQEKIVLPFLAVLCLAGLYFGWRLFWFLTDDAFIAFRYASNSLLGYGYVWNPAPFRAVEGYTSFLWVVILDGVWRISGIQPPESANSLALLFAALTLLLGSWMMLRTNLQGAFKRWRLPLLALALAGVLANRTFLAWTSSGLETALFNCLFTLWIFCVLFLKPYSREWIFGTAVSSGLIYLTRPDGILIAAVTGMLIGLAFYKKWVATALAWRDCLAAGPLLVMPVHLLWRVTKYGAWLPNTYYAKVIPGRIWLESGVRYFLSFVIEYSLWIWLLLLVTASVYRLIQSRAHLSSLLLLNTSLRQIILHPEQGLADLPQAGSKSLKPGWLLGALALGGAAFWLSGRPLWGLGLVGISATGFLLGGVLNLNLTQCVVVSSLLAQFCYYTLAVGGDHFEFRVYSHLILLLFLSAIWLLNILRPRMPAALLFLALMIALSLPIPWTHWAITRNRITREQTGFLKASVAQALRETLPSFPEIGFQYLSAYDRLQFWLIDHGVCNRHQEHKVFYLFLSQISPTRAQGLRISGDGYPVWVASSVGVTAWVLPRVNILDRLGLNDYVIARNMDLPAVQYMAHARQPPEGYLECFSPNVSIEGKTVIVNPRPVELTPEKIRACEEHFETLIRK